MDNTLDTLRAELRRLAEAVNAAGYMSPQQDVALKELHSNVSGETILALLAHIDALEVDARRYRWLRADPRPRQTLKGNLPWPVVVEMRSGMPSMVASFEELLDHQIDAALAEQGEPK